MADRVQTAATAGALIMAGCVAAALGSFAVLSSALCPPVTPGTLPGGCVPADFIPWYGLALLFAVASAGFVMAGLGVVLYRRARIG